MISIFKKIAEMISKAEIEPQSSINAAGDTYLPHGMMDARERAADIDFIPAAAYSDDILGNVYGVNTH